jgi:hypothetical protein
MVIWKKVIDRKNISMTEIQHCCWGRVLSCGKQGDDIVVWFMTDPTSSQDFESKVHFVMTGEEDVLNKDWRFLATMQIQTWMGEIATHVFVEE